MSEVVGVRVRGRIVIRSAAATQIAGTAGRVAECGARYLVRSRSTRGARAAPTSNYFPESVVRPVLRIMPVLVLAAACQDAIAGPPPGFRAVTLATLADGVTGTAAVTDEAGPTSTVRVTLRGVVSGVTYTGHVGSGSCASPGGVAAPLQAAAAPSTSALSSTGGVPDNVLLAGFHIQFSKPGPLRVACGEIP